MPRLCRNAFVAITLKCLFVGLVGGQGHGELSPSKCWSFPIDHVVATHRDQEEIFVATSSGSILALGRNGDKVWQTDLGGAIASNLVSNRDHAFAITASQGRDFNLRAVSRLTGVPSWSVPLSGATGFELAITNATVIITAADGATHAFNAASGATAEPPRSIQAGTALSRSIDGLLVTGDETGAVRVRDTRDTIRWSFRTGGRITHLRTYRDRILVASADNFVYQFELTSGAIDWKRRFPGRIHRLAMVGSNILITSDEQPGIMIVSAASGRTIAQVGLGPEEELVTDPIGDTDTIVIATDKALSAYSFTGPECKGGSSEKSRRTAKNNFSSRAVV